MSNEIKKYTDLSVKKLNGSRVEIVASIPCSVWEIYRGEALKNLNETVALDGFRKGNIPENILISKLGEMTVLEEMAEIAVPRSYVEILISEKIDAIGKPQVQILKLAKDNPIEFKAITDVVPTLSLPDYKEISKNEAEKSSKEKIEVLDKDIEDAILNIRKSFVSHEGHDHEKMTNEEHEKMVMENLPEFSDEFVKKIGDFKDVPDFKNKISVMILDDKKAKAKDKLRAIIADELAQKTLADMPASMIDSELNRIEAQFNADIERMGVKMDDYLKHAKKSLEDIRKEWRPHAEKKAKIQLIINQISDTEKIKPSKEEIEEEVKHILNHYKDADREKATIYAETVLTNDKVFRFLEEIK